MTTLLVPGVPAPSPGQAEGLNGARAGGGFRAWRAYLVVHGPQDSPHVLLRHNQAHLLAGLPQGRVHHVAVSGVTLATWETEQAQGAWFSGCWGRGGVGVEAVAVTHLNNVSAPSLQRGLGKPHDRSRPSLLP